MLYKSCKCNINYTCCHGNQVVVLWQEVHVCASHKYKRASDGQHDCGLCICVWYQRGMRTCSSDAERLRMLHVQVRQT